MEIFHQSQNICRICLVENNEEIQCVFNAVDSTGASVKISEMLMACAKIEIFSGDELPDQICSTCVENTNKLYLFKIKCEESDKTLRNRLKEGSFIVIDKIEINEEDILDKLQLQIKKENERGGDGHFTKQNENNPLETIVYEDYDAWSSPKSLTSSIKTDSSTLLIVEEPLECETTKEKDLLRHKKIAEISHKIKMIDQEFDYESYNINEGKNIANDKKKSLVVLLEDCSRSKNFMDTQEDKKPLPTSGKSSDDEKNIRKRGVTESSLLAKEKIASRKKLYECNNCKIKFSRSVSLATHKCTRHHTEKKYKNSLGIKKRLHTEEKRHKCDVCEKRFLKKNLLVIHKRKHTGEKPYKCDECDKKFAILMAFKNHKRTHTGEKPYKCDVCKKRFSLSSSFIYHKRTHTGEKPYKCDICGKKFMGSSTLIVHRRIHTGEKPYKCDFCEKKFYGSSALRCHIRIHTDDRPYKCDVCVKRYISPRELVKHKRTHTGEKPYKCDVCEMKFTYSNTLQSHKHTHHTGEKSYKCDICEKSFIQPSLLEVHKRRHTGEKPYECDICKKKFSRSGALVCHKRTHTGESIVYINRSQTYTNRRKSLRM